MSTPRLLALLVGGLLATVAGCIDFDGVQQDFCQRNPDHCSDMAPRITDHFQSNVALGDDGTIRLRVGATDFHDSSLRFEWKYSAGTLKRVADSATGSEVLWTPPCPPINSLLKITATVTNELGFSSSIDFYGSATDCSRWRVTSGMDQGRVDHAATLLPSGKVLVTGGVGREGVLASAEIYDPEMGTWTRTASMSQARMMHTATLLPSGKVLVTGGLTSNREELLGSAELYDPNTGGWTPTASMAKGRVGHTATRLPSGKVLVTGGLVDPFPATKTCEVYDPGTGTWVSTAGMVRARIYHTATLLLSGKVLVAGGETDSVDSTSSSEIYNPDTGTWTNLTSMVRGRGGHTATLLVSGKVLVAGGAYDRSGSSSDSELYNPDTDTWARSTGMRWGRRDHTATLLSSGNVLVVGGSSYGGSNGGAVVPAEEVYSPLTYGGWSRTARMSKYRMRHTATMLPSGKVLVVGGSPLAGDPLGDVEVYEPGTGN